MRRFQTPRANAPSIDDLSAWLEEEDDDEELTKELGDELTEPIFDLFQGEDLTPTNVAPRHASAMRAMFRPRRPVAGQPLEPRSFPMPPSARLQTPPPAISLPAHASEYSAPRPPPVSHRPTAAPSERLIVAAEVINASARLPSVPPVAISGPQPSLRPARRWTTFLVAAVVGCAAVLAVVPLVIHYGEFAGAVAQLTQRAAPTTEPVVTERRSIAAGQTAPSVEPAERAALDVGDLPLAEPAESGVMRLDELPIAAASIEKAAREASPAMSEKPIARKASTKRDAEPARSVAAAADTATDKAVLHLVSAPPAHIAIDGRLLGVTPKSVRLSPGTHTIVFASAGGRQQRTVNLAAGGEQSVSVEF